MVVPVRDDPAYAAGEKQRTLLPTCVGGLLASRYDWLFGLRPRRACLVPFEARSATSFAFTSSTTWPRRASA
jgi:hypothetical protein